MARRKTLKRITIAIVLLVTVWIADYAYRSHQGSYHEHPTSGGLMIAVWHPTDFTMRRSAPERPLGNRPSRRRYSPLTELPKKRYLDPPLLTIDRWIIHPTTQMQAFQGDMPYVYRLSEDGRTLISGDSQ